MHRTADPAIGRGRPAARSAFANAVATSHAVAMTSPVACISGPRTGSEPGRRPCRPLQPRAQPPASRSRISSGRPADRDHRRCVRLLVRAALRRPLLRARLSGFLRGGPRVLSQESDANSTNVVYTVKGEGSSGLPLLPVHFEYSCSHQWIQFFAACFATRFPPPWPDVL